MKLFSPVSPFHFSQAEIVKENSLKASVFGKMLLHGIAVWVYVMLLYMTGTTIQCYLDLQLF